MRSGNPERTTDPEKKDSPKDGRGPPGRNLKTERGQSFEHKTVPHQPPSGLSERIALRRESGWKALWVCRAQSVQTLATMSSGVRYQDFGQSQRRFRTPV